METTIGKLRASFQERSDRASSTATVCISCAVLVLLVGVAFFLYTRKSLVVASDTADAALQALAKDVSARVVPANLTPLSRVESFRSTPPPSTAALTKAVDELAAYLKAGHELSEPGWRTGAIKKADAMRALIAQVDKGIALHTELRAKAGSSVELPDLQRAEALNAALSETNQRFVASSKLLQEQVRALTPMSMQSLYAEIAVRVVAVAIGLYLVQILVSMYRLNTRVAYHFQTRADVLLLLEGNQSTELSVPQLVELFGLDHVSLGRSPASLTEQAFKLVGDIAAKNGNARG